MVYLVISYRTTVFFHCCVDTRQLCIKYITNIVTIAILNTRNLSHEFQSHFNQFFNLISDRMTVVGLQCIPFPFGADLCSLPGRVVSLSARNSSFTRIALGALIERPGLTCVRQHLHSLDLSENALLGLATGTGWAHETGQVAGTGTGTGEPPGLVLDTLLHALPALERLVLDNSHVERVELHADTAEKEKERKRERPPALLAFAHKRMPMMTAETMLRGLSLKGNPIAQLHADVLLLPSLELLELDRSRHLKIAGLDSSVAAGSSLNESYWMERLESSRNSRYKRYLQALESPDYDAKRDAFHLRVSLAGADVSSLVEQLATLLVPLSRSELTRVDRAASLLDFLQIDSSGALMACDLEPLRLKLLSKMQRLQHLQDALEWLSRLRCAQQNGDGADTNSRSLLERTLQTNLLVQSQITSQPVAISQKIRVNNPRSCSLPETCHCSQIESNYRELIFNCSHSGATHLRSSFQYERRGVDQIRMDLSHSRLHTFPTLELSTFESLHEIDLRHTRVDLALSLLRALETRVRLSDAPELRTRLRVLAADVPLDCAVVARFQQVALLFTDKRPDCEHFPVFSRSRVSSPAANLDTARAEAPKLTAAAGSGTEADVDADADAVLLLLFGSHSAARLPLRHLALALLMSAVTLSLLVTLICSLRLLRRALSQRHKRRSTAAAFGEPVEISSEPEPPPETELNLHLQAAPPHSPRNAPLRVLPLPPLGNASSQLVDLMALGLLPEQHLDVEGLQRSGMQLQMGNSRSLVLPRRSRTESTWSAEVECEQCLCERLSLSASGCLVDVGAGAGAGRATGVERFRLADRQAARHATECPRQCPFHYQCQCPRRLESAAISAASICGSYGAQRPEPPLSPLHTPEHVSLAGGTRVAPSTKQMAVTLSPRKDFLTTFI